MHSMFKEHSPLCITHAYNFTLNIKSRASNANFSLDNVEKKLHMLVRYVLKHGWAGLSWSLAGHELVKAGPKLVQEQELVA